MYWPIGSASRLALSSTASNDTSRPPLEPISRLHSPIRHPSGSGEILGITPSPPSSLAQVGLFASWTSSELAIWNSRPRVVLTKLARTRSSLARLGINKEVKWRPGEVPMLVILTTHSHLIMYTLERLMPAPTPVYTLPTDQSASFSSTGPAERISLPKIVLKFLREISLPEDAQPISCFELSATHILVCTSGPQAQLHSIPWIDGSILADPDATIQEESPLSICRLASSTLLKNLEWLVDPTVIIVSITYSDILNLYILVTSDGRAYVAHCLLSAFPSGSDLFADEPLAWVGHEFHSVDARPQLIGRKHQKENRKDSSQSSASGALHPMHWASGACAINDRFSLVALGSKEGTIAVYALGHSVTSTTHSHTLDLRQSLNNVAGSHAGEVNLCSWTSDGHALAVSWTNGYSVWSVFGRLQAWGNSIPCEEDNEQCERTDWEDLYMGSGRSLLWGPGNFELFLLTPPPANPTRFVGNTQLFVMPFAKSAVTTLHSPDNTKHAFLQLDDRVWVYRGADSPDMSVINPESDIWLHIKIPADYVSTNWPIEMSCISDDGKLLAVAGYRGFTHFNVVSGRWKLFESEKEEQSICVRGGMQWFGNVLIVGVEEDDMFFIRSFSRDDPLSMTYCQINYPFDQDIVLLSIYDTSLLVYTADNTLHHFLIQDEGLIVCGKIGFEGVVGNPLRVRGMSWLINDSQHRFGDPVNDLKHAAIFFLIDGKVVVLRPSQSGIGQVKYDLQILADKMEFYWTGGQIGTGKEMLENSLWGWDGRRIWVWLDALTIAADEPWRHDDEADHYTVVEGTLTIPLTFYPLSILLDKGIIIGVEHDASIRQSINFATFRITTNTHLLIHHVLRFYLGRRLMTEAVKFASNYSTLVYFSHSLEILLHAVLEDESDHTRDSMADQLSNLEIDHQTNRDLTHDHERQSARRKLLPIVIDFLDHFPQALEVVVNCTRKTEMTEWKDLFQVVGKVRELFEKSITSGALKIASSYLLVLHNLDPLEQISQDTIRLYKIAFEAQDMSLCKELLRFMYSLDHTGEILKIALKQSSAENEIDCDS